MNPKIPRLRAEREKNTVRITKLQARNKILDKQITELENTDIIGLVRTRGFSLEEFEELLGAAAPARPEEEKENECDEN